MIDIVLSTLNARYTHASLGLRCLFANLGELQKRTVIEEFVIGERTALLAERLLAHSPRIIGFGVYIWNVEETTKLVALLKAVAPEVQIVLGGPEVSYEAGEQRIVKLADFVITGWGEVTFPKLCRELLARKPQLQKVVAGHQPPVDELVSPYVHYTDTDIKQRTVYVEASRGCPYRCEFCLSALDKTAWPFELERFLDDMQSLYVRGLRQFKFVDRTFNLNVKASLRILQFFLDRWRVDDPVFAHFELVPDHLPDALKETIARFPAGALQFEIGIQTWNPEIQARISRKQNNEKAEANIRWLATQSNAHMHVDLIAGLPGETLESFALGFDRLWALGPHEIQLGILKRLRGTPIIRHTEAHRMRYNPEPPYSILSTDVIDFLTMQRIERFASYWDKVANSGRFDRTLKVLLGDTPFRNFVAFADELFARTGKQHEIALERLANELHRHLIARAGSDQEAVEVALLADYAATGAKGRLSFMTRGLSVGQTLSTQPRASQATPKRQTRHLETAEAAE